MVVNTTASVIKPPKTTDGTNPINLAVTPDSNAPNSFDDPIKIQLKNGSSYNNTYIVEGAAEY
jgi:hypothetical protein